MHLTFWQPIPSFHQEGFLCALAAAPWVSSVTLRHETNLPSSRRASGWREARFEGVRLAPITPDSIPEAAADHVHLFTGFLTHPGVWAAFGRIPREAACRLYAYTEAPELHDWRGPLRKLKYTLAARRLAGRLDGILAIGGIGETFYRQVARGRIPVHPFAYYDRREADFPPSPKLRRAQPPPCIPPEPSSTCLPSEALAKEGSTSLPASPPYRFLIAGQLIRRKGVDLALRALAACARQDWTLDIVGDGPERESLGALARSLGIEARVRWHGVRPTEALADFYAAADCVLLPSRWDGWGMSVNEALRHGCEVAVSRTSGAASLVGDDRLLPTSPAAWPPLLERLILAGPPSPPRRDENQALARTVGAEAGVAKLRDILEITA